MGRTYDDNVFINCPFDDAYRPLFQALIFAVHACGLIARSALEIDDAAEVRIDKIARIISECRHGIHDLSRIEPDEHSGYPRMNMPFELGLFLGARRFGDAWQKRKTCIIFDHDRYRYQQFLSDIAGQDIRAHGGEAGELIRGVRNALSTTRPADILLPSGRRIARRYAAFREELPELCDSLGLDHDDLGHGDLVRVVMLWLQRSPGSELSAN